MCNCGKPTAPAAVWVVNPERHFCTCVRTPITYIPPVSGFPTALIDSIKIELQPRRVEASRPSEV